MTVEDTTAPVITLNGQPIVTHEGGDVYKDAGATAVDALDGDVTVAVTGNVDVNKLGPYEMTYTAKDAEGNQSTTTRRVNVVDTTSPVIT